MTIIKRQEKENKHSELKIEENINNINYFWVNVGTSKNIVKKEEFLWAPLYYINSKTKNKCTNAGWEQVKNIKKGDVIFCCFNQKINYIAVAKEDSYESKRPGFKEFESWEKEGTKVNVELKVLENPLNVNNIKPIIKKYYNHQCKPLLITKNNGINQSYMINISDSAASLILNSLDNDAILIQEIINKNRNRISRKPNKTTKEAIIQSRIGQGKFREELLELWNNTCPVTKVNNKDLLIASHIHSWSLSNDEEKLDKYNGLPLTPSLDKLFDKGFISFSNEGKLLVNKLFNEKTLILLGINLSMKIDGLVKEHHYYLEKHRRRYNIEE